MLSFYLVRSEHGRVLAVYASTGAVCCVEDHRLGGVFAPLFLAVRDGAELMGQTGFLIAGEPTRSFFARPFRFPNFVLPVRLEQGVSRSEDAKAAVRFGLRHPGSPLAPLHLRAILPGPNRHFEEVIVDAPNIADWESFELVDLPGYFVGERIRDLAGQAAEYAMTDPSDLGSYAHFGDDALAASGCGSIPLSELVAKFESLGENCEFGFVQRRCGAEPLGLLRFGGGLRGDRLPRAIASRFEGFGQPVHMRGEVMPNDPREVMVHDHIGLWAYHTWRDDVTDMPKILDEEGTKIRYLAHKMLEDLEDGEKIFVLTTREEQDEGRVDATFQAMRGIGPATLLSVVTSDLDHPAGTVVCLRDGFLRGYIDAFAPHPWDPPLQPWIRLCRNAYALHIAGRSG